MRFISSRWFLLTLLLCLCAIAVALVQFSRLHSYWYGKQGLSFPAEQLFQVESGDNLSTVLKRVDALSTDAKPLLSRLSLRLFAGDRVIRSGEYALSGQLSREDLLQQFATGASKQYRVTLVDGHSLDEMLETVAAAFRRAHSSDAGSAAEEYDVAALRAALIARLDPRAIEMMDGAKNPEGWLSPDTYFFVRDSDPIALLERAHQRMLNDLLTAWPERREGLPLTSPYEALVLASIVERESGHVDERREIAGVFSRRLQRGMKLQTDPTVIYGMGERYRGNLTRSDLRRDTPFNTYTRHGLPPTPIANPGRASILAALNPAPGSALYFVAKGDGSHQFSDTLEAHNKAVYRYQIKQRRADYRSAPSRS